MNGTSLEFFIAACAGIAAGCFSLYLFRVLEGIEFDRKAKFEKPLPLFFRLLYPFLPPVRRISEAPGCENWRKAVQPKLLMAGYGDVLSPGDFIGIKLLFVALALLLAGFGVFSAHPGASLLVAALLVFYPGAWLNATIKRRQLSIMKALPNVLDLLTLSVESGRDLISALRDILTRRRPDDLGEELSRTFQEIQLGRKRSEALRAMAARVRQVDLTATVNAIVQAEELGVSIAQLLRIQGDAQRNKRFSMAEKLANEASVKIIIPVVLFILPAVFIILLGPLILQTAQMFR